ncbi:hypothetical protein [Kitasatospora viridis]|uniref:Methyltransferase family protein n=1 Tax=Kitasatospora viridis TaxID=281105 RepID=A0A561SA04_9ACTN|nr:hypothetical protein [Kitasatospora viridis]TWF71701.1 hypothetical protein FHX73_1872 [Kitasatospora viridis]
MTDILEGHGPLIDPARAVEALQAAWKNPELPEKPFFFSEGAAPLAGGPHDQLVPDGVQNPYWEVVRWMPSTPPVFGTMPEVQMEPMYFAPELSMRLALLGASRQQLCTQYAWSIPSPGDITWMVEQLGGRAVVEVGAGTGYWAWQLEQAGVDVAAYDPLPPGWENRWCSGGPYTTVLVEGAEAAAAHPDRVLLMVWPPHQGEHARHALSVYQGDLLLYAGEGWGGANADDGFYELLDEEWVEVSASPAHVNWWGIRCRLAAYRRQ